MPHIVATLDFTPQDPPPSSLKKFALMLRKIYEQLARVINGGISFGNGVTPDNVNGVWASVANTGAANTNFTITHNLLRVPVGFILVSQTLGGVLYLGSVAATQTTITLKCTVANNNILVFIM
jgi:hypothetical protein